MSNPIMDRAVLALQMHQPAEAEHLASSVLKSDRSNAFATEIFGRALLMQNRASEAVTTLQKAARRSDDPAIETLLAVALAAAGQTDDALDQLHRTIERRPPFLPAFLEYGGQLSQAGYFDAGVTVLERGLALAPDALDLRMALGYLHVNRNARTQARAVFTHVLAEAPERQDAKTWLAKVLLLDGEYAAAADIYRHILALEPNDADARNHLAKCLLELGDRDAGEAALRAAARAAPQLAARSIQMLAASSHGRFFLRPSAAAAFLRGNKS